MDEKSTEVWRDVPGYDGIIQVSSLGKVRSMRGKSPAGRVLTPQFNNSGYLRVSITFNKVASLVFVHALVCRAFHGQRPTGADVNHINGIKTDNRPENLEYVTRSENMQHAQRIGIFENRGEACYNAKLTEADAVHILWSHSTCGTSAKEMAPSLGVAVRTVADVLQRKTWRHIHWPDQYISNLMLGDTHEQAV